MAITALRELQLGKETTAGTAVAATVVYQGQGIGKDESPIEHIPQDIGQMVPKPRSMTPRSDATVTFDPAPATFEQLGYWFDAGIEAPGTPTADTGGAGHIYQYDLSNTTAASINTYTIETGNAQESNEMEYSFVEEFTLSGASGEAVMVGGTWRGRQQSDCAFTALSVSTVEPIYFNKGKIYIDAAGGTIGTTQKTATWLGFEISGPTGVRAIHSGDGNLYFAAHEVATSEITGSLTLRHNATGEAEIGIAATRAARLVRMTFEGATLTTAGSSYTYKTLNIDMAIQYTEVPTIEEADGLDNVTLPFRIVDSDSEQLQFIIVNELAALT